MDQRALARAFKSLEAQEFTFDECDVRVVDRGASAACRGSVTYIPKVGSKTAHTGDRQWNFELQKQQDVWLITRATINSSASKPLSLLDRITGPQRRNDPHKRCRFRSQAVVCKGEVHTRVEQPGAHDIPARSGRHRARRQRRARGHQSNRVDAGNRRMRDSFLRQLADVLDSPPQQFGSQRDLGEALKPRRPDTPPRSPGRPMSRQR